VGDSITYGSGIQNREVNSYPAVLDRCLGPRFEVGNFGVSGATLLKKGDKPYWEEPEFSAVQEYEPDVILFMLGTNDTKPQNWQFENQFEADLRDMLIRFRQLPSQPRIWVCLPVPVYATRWGINQETLTGSVIPTLREVSEQLDLPVINLYGTLSNRPEWFPDDIHPNATGAAMMAQTICYRIVER
jgi:lysophospholipase L1-like esterase